MDKLPKELIRLIFEYTVEDEYAKDPQAVYTWSKSHLALRLGNVCKKWRETVQDHTLFCKSVDLHEDLLLRNSSDASFIGQSLRKMGISKLNIVRQHGRTRPYLEPNPPVQIDLMPFLQPTGEILIELMLNPVLVAELEELPANTFPRFKRLEFVRKVQCHLRPLEKISAFCKSPLEHVVLSRDLLKFAVEGLLGLRWESLTRLEEEHSSRYPHKSLDIDTYFIGKALPLCAMLRTLVVYSNGDRWGQQWTGPTPRLPLLEFLAIRGQDIDLKILSHMSVPNLKALTIDGDFLLSSDTLHTSVVLGRQNVLRFLGVNLKTRTTVPSELLLLLHRSAAADKALFLNYWDNCRGDKSTVLQTLDALIELYSGDTRFHVDTLILDMSHPRLGHQPKRLLKLREFLKLSVNGRTDSGQLKKIIIFSQDRDKLRSQAVKKVAQVTKKFDLKLVRKPKNFVEHWNQDNVDDWLADIFD